VASRNLGTLTVDLALKSGLFEQGMDRAAKASEKNLNRIKATASGLGTAFVAGLAALGSSKLLGAIVQETTQAENAMRQLEARLKSTGGVAGVTGPEIQALAKELQGLTTFGDDAIVEMEALLLSFTNIRGDTVRGATEAILDLSTALGMDLQSAATLVGKALNDPKNGMTALGRVGVKLSADQQKLVKSFLAVGDAASAQNVILKELERRFGGSAAAAADTFGGAIKQLQNAFGDLLEGEGSGVNGAKEAIQGFTEILKDPATVRAAAALTSGILEGLAAVIKAVSATVQAFEYLGENIDKSPVFSWANTARKELKLFTSDLEDIQNDIKFLEEARDSFAPFVAVLGKQSFAPDSLFGILSRDDINKRLAELNQQAAKLQKTFSTGGPIRRKNFGSVDAPDLVPSEEYTKAKEELTRLIESTKQQTVAFEESAEAAMRYRLTQGDLKDEMKLLGAEGVKLSAQLVEASRAVDVSRSTKTLEDFNKSLQAQTEGLADNEAAAIRYRLEIGDLAEAVKRAGEAGQALKLEIIASADAKQQKDDLRDIEAGLMAVNAQILQFQGREEEGALLAFDKENAELVKVLRRQANDAGLEQIDTLRDLIGAQAELNKLHRQAAAVREEAAANEDRIRNSLESGAITELDSIVMLDEARKKTLVTLQAIYDKQKAITDNSGSETMVQDTKQFSYELENLAAQTDLLTKKIRSSLEDAGTDAFADFITGAKSGSDAIKAFAADFEREIAQLIAKDLMKRLFNGLLGTDDSSGWFAAAAGFFAGRASGGPITGGTPYLVGERGPEIIVPRGNATVIPNNKLISGTTSVVNNFNITSNNGVSLETQQQIANRVAAAMAQARRRNG